MVRIVDLAGGAFWQLLGIETARDESDRTILKMPVEDKLLQFYGKVHGGAIATLVDAATAVALNQELGPERGASTVEMKINFIRAVEKGVLYARGEVIHLGRTLAVGNTYVWDDQGHTVAYGSGTFYLFEMDKT